MEILKIIGFILKMMLTGAAAVIIPIGIVWAACTIPIVGLIVFGTMFCIIFFLIGLLIWDGID